jgi:hypothetical protein
MVVACFGLIDVGCGMVVAWLWHGCGMVVACVWLCSVVAWLCLVVFGCVWVACFG